MHARSAVVGIWLLLTPTFAAQAAIIEAGDLNVISQAGNPSDGLRFLDMSFGVGLSLAAALTNAQLSFPDARLATPSEFDDLFAASDIVYNGAPVASDGFAAGSTVTLSSGTNYDGGALRDILGATDSAGTLFIWTDPDGSIDPGTTRDLLQMTDSEVRILNTGVATPPTSNVGWLFVSDQPVPTPGTLVLCALGLAGLALGRRTSLRPSA